MKQITISLGSEKFSKNVPQGLTFAIQIPLSTKAVRNVALPDS